VAPAHEAPEHEPPGHRPKKRTDTLGDVQRALRIRGARPKLAGRRAKPGIRKWRETSVARCSGGCPLPLPRGCGGLARPLAVHCYAPLTASSACGCRPPHARRLRVRRRLPPESNALPSRASVRRGVAAGRGALYIACASPPPKSSAAAYVSVLECVHIEQLTINNNTRSTRNQATAPRREERCTAPGRLPSGAGRLRHSTEQTWLAILSTFVGASGAMSASR